MAMTHASNLRTGSICGIFTNELPEGDRLLAALIPETQVMVKCDRCREMLGLVPWQ